MGKFKGFVEGKRFDQRGTGLRAEVTAIQQRTQRETDAIELAKIQHKEASSNWIAGASDAFNFTEKVQRKKAELKDKQRVHAYEALRKLAETDVDRLKGIAAEKQKEVDHYKELAPKRAKMVQNLVTGIWQFQDTVRGIGEFNARDGSGLLDYQIDGHVDVESALFKSLSEDHRKLILEAKKTGDWSKVVEANAIWSQKKLSTTYARQKLLDFTKKNKDSISQEVYAELGRHKINLKTEEDARPYYELYAHTLLKASGIKPTTKQGREIINIYKTAGRLDYKGKVDARSYTDSNTNIQNQAAHVYKLGTNHPDFKTEFNGLITLELGRTIKVGNKYLRGHANGVSHPDAYLNAGKAIVDAGIKDGLDESTLQEILATAETMPSKGNTKVQQYAVKHEGVTEQIVEYYREKRDEHINEKDQVIAEADFSTLTRMDKDLTNKPWEFQTDDNGDLVLGEDGKPVALTQETGFTTMKDWKWKKLLSTATNPKISDSAKNKIYAKLQFVGLNTTIDNMYIDMTDLYKRGDEDSIANARSIYDSATPTEQKKLRPLFENLQYLHKAIVPYKAPGSETVYSGSKANLARIRHSVFIPTEGANFNALSKLHESASGAIIAFDNAVDDLTLSLKDDPRFKDNPQGAYNEAFNIVKAEYDKGEKGEGRWARTGGTTANPGDSPRQLIYTNYKADLTTNDTERLNMFWGKGEEDREQAKRELLAYKGPEYDAEMTNNILKHRLLSEGAFKKENEAKLLTDQKFLNGSTVQYIHGEITAWNKGETGVWGYPPQLQAYAKYKGITNRKALQTVFNIYAKEGLLPEITVPEDSTDAAIDIKNDGKYFLQRNEKAICAYSACKAQNVMPKSFNVDYTLQGMDKETAAAKSLGVEFLYSEDGIKSFTNPQDGIKSELFYENMIDWNTANKLNVLPFTRDINSWEFPFHKGKPVKITYADKADIGTQVGATKKNAFGQTLVYSVISGSNARKHLGWKLQ